MERGENASLFCPLHENTRTRAFSINLDSGLWVCFGCGQKGNLTQLYDKLGEVPDGDLRLRLAAKSAQLIPAERPNLDGVWVKTRRDAAGAGFHAAFASYAGRRGIHPSAIEAFSIGYDRERNALSFPYFDGTGRVTGIKYRLHRGGKTSEGGSEYGLYNLPGIVGRPTVFLCEGESDTHAVWSALLLRCNQVAVGGTSGASVDSRSWQLFSLDLLFASRVYLGYDADEAGDKCAERAASVLGDRAIRIRPTKGKDLCEHLLSGGNLVELGLDEADL